MIKNYIKTTFRSFAARRTYSLINIFGLAIGIAGFLIIYLFIFDELSYDRHHSEAKNIYRLVNVYDFDGVMTDNRVITYEDGKEDRLRC